MMLHIDSNTAETERNSAFRGSGSDLQRNSHIEQFACFNGPSAWSIIPDETKQDLLMPSLSDRSAAISAMTDAAATAAAVASCDARMIGAPAYYNTGYSAANYGMYAAGTSNYYPVPSTLRATATHFPFAAPPHPYYGNGYSTAGFEYAPYPTSIQCYGSRNTYYAHPINSVTSSSSLYTMSSLSAEAMTSSQLPSFTSKADVKKPLKGMRKKKTVGASFSPDDHYTRVFIWEMEDVCVLSNFFLRSGDPLRSHRLANSVNASVNSFIALAFGIENTDDCDQMNIEDTTIDEPINDMPFIQNSSETSVINQASTSTHLAQSVARGGVDWMRRLAVKYQHIKDIYTLYRNNYTGLIERNGITSERAELLAFKNTIDPLTQGWTDSIGRCLKLIVERSSRNQYANILITSESIVPTLAKLLISEQSSMIPAENVYSTLRMSKESVIDRILSRFGKKCSFVIISTHLDTHEIAKKENIPLWKIKSVRDLELFHIALTHHLLS